MLWGGLTISIACFALRIFVRIKSFKRLYADDGLVFFALLSLFVTVIIWQYAKEGLYTQLKVLAGLEESPADMTQRVEQYLRLTGIILVLFYTSLWAVKLSFLMLFKRMGRNVKNQKIIWWSVAVFVVLGYAASVGTVDWKCLFSSFTVIVGQCLIKPW